MTAAKDAFLGWFGSLKLSLAVLILLLVGVELTRRGWLTSVQALALPGFLFSVNLVAAIAGNARFRRQPALMVFHLALLAIVLLVAFSRLTYLKGTLELTRGVPFQGELVSWEAGPWHPWGLDRVSFVHDGFTLDYGPQRQRREMVNPVRWVDEGGVEQRGVIGDETPLVLRGYRIYTTTNQGYALLMTWLPRSGAPESGSVHLPSFPRHGIQTGEWRLPGVDVAMMAQWEPGEVWGDPERPLTLGGEPPDMRITVRVRGGRQELRPGESLTLPEGVLVYRGMVSWVGYRIFYDVAMSWLLAACGVAVVALGWHYWQRFRQNPWMQGG